MIENYRHVAVENIQFNIMTKVFVERWSLIAPLIAPKINPEH